MDPDAGPLQLDISDATAPAGQAWVADKIYQITFSDTATVLDANGGPVGGPAALPGAADLTICFSTASS
jgi:hypothetical protein